MSVHTLVIGVLGGPTRPVVRYRELRESGERVGQVVERLDCVACSTMESSTGSRWLWLGIQLVDLKWDSKAFRDAEETTSEVAQEGLASDSVRCDRGLGLDKLE